MDEGSAQTRGLKRDITPCFGVQLVREGHRLHLLVDRARFTGSFSEVQTLQLGEAFPHFVAHPELMLLSYGLNPKYVHCVTLYRSGLTGEADTLDSHGYVHITTLNRHGLDRHLRVIQNGSRRGAHEQ